MSDRIILVATSSVLGEYDGRPLYIHKGVTTVRDGHPLLEKFGEHFAPLTPMFEVSEEQEEGPEPKVEEEEKEKEAPPTVASETPDGSGASPDPKDVRAWAAEQGIEVSPKGKIPAGVVEQYQAAHTEA